MLPVFVLAAAVASATPVPDVPPLTGRQILALIRNKFRSHRPPPPYVVYTMTRKQKDINGFPDYAESYAYKIWTRSSDRASLARKLGPLDPSYRGPLEFQRPAFNEPRDPGPPTADLFEPAPKTPHSIDFVPTPEPAGTAPPVIASVVVTTENDYNVTKVATEGELVHLSLEPVRDPDRNRLRDIWADKSTYELRKIVATDKLFLGTGGRGTEVYPETFTIDIAMLQGRPVVTDIHGVTGGGYDGGGKTVELTFRDISFPASLPDWYFDAKGYRGREKDAPE